MRAVSHRGAWKVAREKNTLPSLAQAFDLGFGVETDLRDLGGRIVISHDMPTGNEPTFAEFLGLPRSPGLPLALNIKADGLAAEVSAALEQLGGDDDAFVFDMSVPDTRSYLQLGVPVFTRMSEVERQPAWLEESAGVWLDSFSGTWFDNALVDNLLESGKRVCVVSPELHGRDHIPLWNQLAQLVDHSGVLLCTDMPLEADKFFRESS